MPEVALPVAEPMPVENPYVEEATESPFEMQGFDTSYDDVAEPLVEQVADVYRLN